jgi:4-alpha-glucanotransferase
VLSISSVRQHLAEDDVVKALDGPGLPHALHEALIESLYAAGSNLLIVPIQDVFGWRDRINQPATISADNWTWRLPWSSDQLHSEPVAIQAREQLAEWSQRHGRT